MQPCHSDLGLVGLVVGSCDVLRSSRRRHDTRHDHRNIDLDRRPRLDRHQAHIVVERHMEKVRPGDEAVVVQVDLDPAADAVPAGTAAPAGEEDANREDQRSTGLRGLPRLLQEDMPWHEGTHGLVGI